MYTFVSSVIVNKSQKNVLLMKALKVEQMWWWKKIKN